MWSFKAGDADRKATVQVLTPSTDEMGEEIETWSNFCEVWVIAKDARAGRLAERFEENQVIARQVKEFTFRWQSSLSDMDAKTHRMFFENRAYDTLSIQEMGRHAGIRVTGEARAD